MSKVKPAAPTAAEASPLVAKFKSARRVSAPLVAINTPDPATTILEIVVGVNDVAGPKELFPADLELDVKAAEKNYRLVTPALAAPKLEWDFIRGFVPRNNSGVEWHKQNAEKLLNNSKADPIAALIVAHDLLPAGSMLFIHLSHRWIAECGMGPAFVQGVWNLRDRFKADHRTLVLLSPHMPLPAELADDVFVLDEPLPNEAQLGKIVADTYFAADMPVDETKVGLAVEALRGLSAFAAEQITAMSLKKSGLDIDALWERKRQQIEQTPGLKVFRGGESFSAIGGCSVVKSFLTRVIQGEARPHAVVFVDEIEKMLGGSKGDLSGVTQDQLGSLLSYMQDHNAAGMIFIGPPGAAKSAIAKAAGNEGGVPTIQLDLGAAKGSLVGQSEQQLRQALKVITAVSNGRSLWIATCNSIADLPPELRRRFTLGTFFFDLPDAEERKAIWDIWVKHFFPTAIARQADAAGVADEGWTGAEIRQCCDIAWRLQSSLREAAAFVVPVSRSAADKIEGLRKQADGRFLSASRPGVYTSTPAAEGKPTIAPRRKLQVQD